MDKFSCKVHRVHMELGGKLLDSLRIETQFLERLQSVSFVDGAAHTQKDDVESNGGSLGNVAKVFVLFLCGVQLVLRHKTREAKPLQWTAALKPTPTQPKRRKSPAEMQLRQHVTLIIMSPY